MVRAFWLMGLVSALVQAEQVSTEQRRTIIFDTSFLPIDELGSTLSVMPDTIIEGSPLLKASGLQRRKAIEVVVATFTVATSGFTAIIAAYSAIELYDKIAAKIKSKSDKNSCTLTYGTDSDDGVFEGYAFKATTSGSNCDTTAIEKTIKNAVYECANKLHNAGAIRGCCRSSHGGTWTGHLRLTADPGRFPATDVDC